MNSYYTFRLGQSRQGELEDDPRLAALEKAWFYGKRGLDIGCNSGDLTIAIGALVGQQKPERRLSSWKRVSN